PFRCGARGQLFELRFAEHGILEERSGAAAIVVSGDNQHALASPYLTHRLAGLGERWQRLSFGNVPGKVLLQIGIPQTWSATALQPEVHSQDNVPPAFRTVKDAGAISESAGRLGQYHNPVFLQVERSHRFDG